jgi:hypothetical protein
MLRPPLYRLALWGLVCAQGCAGEDGAGAPPDWSFVPPDQPAQVTLDPAEVGAAVERSLPLLAAVRPAELELALDTLAEALGPCGVYSYDEGATRYWQGEISCDSGGVEGFSYEFSGEFDPVYTPGFTGSYEYVVWTASAWSGDLHVWGNADWGKQDYVYEDGTASEAVWFEGDLHTDPAHRPSWFVGELAPNAVLAWTTGPGGERYGYLDGSTVLDDPLVDALNVAGVSVGPDCTDAWGVLSVHARGGGWYDLSLAGTDGACVSCGMVTDPEGVELGSVCLDLNFLLEGGLP